jgi:transcription initiation factor TFIID subunit 2
MATELDFCRYLLDKFHAFWESNKAPYLEPFLQPVDEVNDFAPGYYAMVRQPIDLSTMRIKLTNGLYADAAAFEADFVLMMKACRLYNAGNEAFVRKYADRFEKDFEWEWSGMGKWITAERRKLRAAAAAPTTTHTTAPTAPTAPTATIAPGVAAPAPAPSASSSGSERYVIKILVQAFSGCTRVSLFHCAFQC